MSTQTNLQKDVLVLNMEQQLCEIAGDMYGRKVEELSDQEAYYVVLTLARRLLIMIAIIEIH